MSSNDDLYKNIFGANQQVLKMLTEILTPQRKESKMTDINDLLEEAGIDPNDLGEEITVPKVIAKPDKLYGMFLVWNKEVELQVIATDPAHAVTMCNEWHDLALPVRVTSGQGVWLVSDTGEGPVMSDCPDQNIPNSESSMMMQRMAGELKWLK